MSVTDPPARILDTRISRWGFLGALGIGVAPVFVRSAVAQAAQPREGDQKAEGGAPAKPGDERKPPGEEEKKLSPEEKMARRFPQPVKVFYLVGLPMLDESNSTLGHVRAVVRSGDGKIKLVIDYGGLFGIGERLIAVPIEVCAMLGRQVAALDMPRDAFEPAPTWYGSGDREIGPEETIRVAVTRR